MVLPDLQDGKHEKKVGTNCGERTNCFSFRLNEAAMKRNKPLEQIVKQSADRLDTPNDQFAEALAPIMFWMSLASLALTASVLVLWIDVPRVDESMMSTASVSTRNPADPFAVVAQSWGVAAFGLLLGMWPIFAAEQLWCFLRTKRGESYHHRHRYWWAFCICPPLRMCARHRGSSDRDLGASIGNADRLQR